MCDGIAAHQQHEIPFVIGLQMFIEQLNASWFSAQMKNEYNGKNRKPTSTCIESLANTLYCEGAPSASMASSENVALTYRRLPAGVLSSVRITSVSHMRERYAGHNVSVCKEATRGQLTHIDGPWMPDAKLSMQASLVVNT